MSGIAAAFHRIGPYGLASVLQAGSSFVVLPLLLLLLGAGGYAKFALLEPVIAVLAQVVLLGGHQGLIHAVCKENKPLKTVLVGLILGSHLFLIPMLVLIGALVWCWQTNLLIASTVAIALYFEAINLLFLTAARAIAASWAYFTAVCLRVAVMLGGVSMALAVVGRNGSRAEFVLALTAVAACVSMLGLVATLYRRLRTISAASASATSNVKLTLNAVSYGFPIVLASMCQAVIAFSDRYVLAAYAQPQTVAGYVVAVKLANALNFVSTPVNLWWPTARFAHQKDPDGGLGFFRQAAVSLGGVYGLAAITLIAISPWLLPRLGPGAPVLLPVACILVVAAYLACMQVVLNVGLLSAGHTRKNFFAAAIVAVFNVAGCSLVVPVYGAVGAAIVSAVSAFSLLILLHIFSQRVILVPQRYSLLGMEALSVCAAAVTVNLWVYK